MKLVCQEGLLPGKDRREKFHNAREYGFAGVEVGGRVNRTGRRFWYSIPSPEAARDNP